MSKQLNHVIFLGAGASFNSGYPIGQGLRLRMSSENHFETELEKLVPKNTVDRLLYESAISCRTQFKSFEKTVKLFRHGGFATVDEFSKLASEGHQTHVQDMKKLMRVALSLHNPEEKFHESDYYPFIQRLFREDQLDALRPEITVLTYNYDCYFDFLLLEAFRHRQKISKNPHELNDFWSNKLTSGFFKQSSDGKWATQTQNFNYYKLHGSIAFGNNPYFGHNASFREETAKRLGFLGNNSLQQEVPPVVFPWELFDGDSGNFISEDEFIFAKEYKDTALKEKGRLLFQHFKLIWENAKRTVQRADKISFVGLSMHPYIHDGLRYLFEGKSNGIQAVVANKANKQFEDAKNRLHPSSPCGRVAEIFRKIAPKMNFSGSTSEFDGTLVDDADTVPAPDITPRYSFLDFIEHEMD